MIDQYPGIDIVGTLAGDWNREKGRQAAEEFLGANPPGTLDVIWAASGEMGLGAMLAVEAAGRQKVRAFSEEDIAILQTMAGQVAKAIDNARLFKQTEDALEELKAIQRRYIRAGWEKYLKSNLS